MANVSATLQQPFSVATDRETDTTNQKQTTTRSDYRIHMCNLFLHCGIA